MIFTKKQALISAEEARQQAAEGAVLLDVRTPEEYQTGHIPGAVNLPLDELDQIESVLADSSKTLIVYCQSGMRSAAAARMLQRLGWEVSDLGSVHNWPFGYER